MPGVSLHTAFALDLLERPETSSVLPIAHRTELRDIFLLGSFAPDMGYVTPGLRYLSLLTHLGPTIRFTEHLLETAERPEERAFAWGWYSHVVADIHVHPLINRRVDRIIDPDVSRSGRLTERQLLHFRVEMGLDTHVYAQRPDVRESDLPRAWDGDLIRWLQDAFQQVHGERPPAAHLRTGLWGTHLTARATDHIQHGWAREGLGRTHLSPHRPAETAVRLMGRFRSTALLGPDGPLPADGDLLTQLEEEWPRMKAAFLAALDAGLSQVRDRNLNDGKPAGALPPEDVLDLHHPLVSEVPAS